MSSPKFLQNLSNLGIGYSIAITVGLLVLVISLLIISYFCFRLKNPNPNGSPNQALARVVFVSEDDDDSTLTGNMGISEYVLSTYPKFVFDGTKLKSEKLCAICLGEYKEGDMIRKLPECSHCFHLWCIDAWLRINSSCPVCRTSPVPTPGATPLAEVVPLSQWRC